MSSISLPFIPIRFAIEREHGIIRNHTTLLRMWWRWNEVAYIVFALRGLRAEIEFPSDWHQHRRGWVHLGFGLFTIAFAFPWKWIVPDEGQCSGPRYGFAFFGDKFWLYFGKDSGHSRDGRRYIALSMPWEWRHRMHEVLGEGHSYPYIYTLRSGEVQLRTATIKEERRVWTRPWFPWKRDERYIDVHFSDEVGERSGTWKGGCIGCDYQMLEGETPLTTLRRMEAERQF